MLHQFTFPNLNRKTKGSKSGNEEEFTFIFLMWNERRKWGEMEKMEMYLFWYK